MVRPDEGGASGPTGVGYKLDVKVESLRTLATEIADDLKDFDGEFESWNQKGKLAHPLNAQYRPEKANVFEEGYTLDGTNQGSYMEVTLGVQLLRKGLEALHTAADSLADTYKNLDDANALSVSRVEQMFPEPGKPGTPTEKLPPLDQWKGKALADGFDLDGDGVINPDKGDILFAPSTGKKPEFANDPSVNDRPDDERPENHDGYEKPVDETLPSGGLSEDVFEEYQEQKAEEPVILAPAAPGETYDSGSSSGTVTA